jgi:hypothetical protein
MRQPFRDDTNGEVLEGIETLRCITKQLDFGDDFPEC